MSRELFLGACETKKLEKPGRRGKGLAATTLQGQHLRGRRASGQFNTFPGQDAVGPGAGNRTHISDGPPPTPPHPPACRTGRGKTSQNGPRRPTADSHTLRPICFGSR